MNDSQSIAARPNLTQLRALLAARNSLGWKTRQPIGGGAATGVTSLDKLLVNGLESGQLYECVTEGNGSGSATLMAAILATMQKRQRWAALVDGNDSFDPACFETDCSRILWVRCQHAAQAIKATDLLLRDRNLELVILDLAFNPSAQLNKISSSVWFRLQRLLELGHSKMLVLTSRRLVTARRTSFTLGGQLALADLDRERTELLDALQLAIVTGRSNIPSREPVARSASPPDVCRHLHP